MVDRPIARSTYRWQVQRIAPPYLADREEELAELAQFCTAEETTGVYRYWQAPAWAGKSALMAWFVLHPPPGVRVVSFFVTARYAGQSDRVAFTDQVVEQLAEILGEPVPAHLTDATRDQSFLEMLERAAQVCLERGDRLVMLVDGLDEDRGVTGRHDAYSVAALLPERPPAGVRVVVAGRPHPRVPSDVPPTHPLREPAVVRPLGRSRHAEAVRTDLEREVTKLLDGTPTEQDLLGVLVGAGGGLSAVDLGEILGMPEWEVRRHLGTVAGRSFRPRLPRWYRDRPEVYVLGHEDLQAMASERLGRARLAGYRERLHTWADEYRQRGWPDGTPEYLLHGYFRTLAESGDTTRMLTCGTDRPRHDRMLQASGGDAATLAEVNTAQDALMKGTAPDLHAVARLVVHRDDLVRRNSRVPAGLPAVWEALGMPARADATVESIAPSHHREAFVRLGMAAYARNRHNRAEQAAERALNSPEPAATRHRHRIAADMVRLLCAIDEVNSAYDFASQLNRQERATAFVALARATGDPAALREARKFATDMRTPLEDAAETLTELLVVLANGDDDAQADSVMAELRALGASPAHTATVGGGRRPWTMDANVLTVHLWRAGRGTLAAAAEALETLYTTDRQEWLRAFEAVAGDLASSGAGQFVERWSASLPDVTRVEILGAVLRAAVEAGDDPAASRLAVEAEQLATSIADAGERTTALTSLAACVGDPVAAQRMAERAGRDARTSLDVEGVSWVLATLAERARTSGDCALATQLSAVGWEVILAQTGFPHESYVYRHAIAGLDRPADPARWRGALDRAQQAAEHDALEALRLAEVMVGQGERSRALALAAVAESTIEDYQSWHAQTVGPWVLQVEAMAGAITASEALAVDQRLDHRVLMLIALAETTARNGESAGARRLLCEAARVAVGEARSVGVLIDLAIVAHAIGEDGAAATAVADAVALCAELPPDKRVDELYSVARTAELAGISEHDQTLARLSLNSAARLILPRRRALAFAVAAAVSPPSTARDLALRSFALGGCWSTITCLAVTDPEVLRVTSDEFTALLPAA